MAKGKKSIADVKKDGQLKTLKKKEMSKILGGKKKRKWNNGCGGIVPQ